MAFVVLWLAPRLEFEEQLEALMSQHKDLLEFHVSHTELCHLHTWFLCKLWSCSVTIRPAPGDHSWGAWCPHCLSFTFTNIAVSIQCFGGTVITPMESSIDSVHGCFWDCLTRRDTREQTITFTWEFPDTGETAGTVNIYLEVPRPQ